MGSGVTPPLSPPETVRPLKKATCFVALGPLAPTYCLSTPPLVSLRAPRIWRFLNGLKPKQLPGFSVQVSVENLKPDTC